MREGQSYGRYQRGRGREREPLLRWPEGPLCQWAPFPPRPAPVCTSALGDSGGASLVPAPGAQPPEPRLSFCSAWLLLEAAECGLSSWRPGGGLAEAWPAEAGFTQGGLTSAVRPPGAQAAG